MKPLLLAVLAALIAASVIASRLGGALGSGVLLGYTLGAGLAGLSTLYTSHVARTRPARALQASVLGFLVELAAVLCFGLVFRYVEAAAERADYRSFLIAFAAAVALVLPIGTWAALHDRRRAAPSRAAPQNG